MTQVPPFRPRARECGLVFGDMSPGEYNAITDVDGVRVGQVTLFDDGPTNDLRSAIRTGVTAILPHGGNLFREKVVSAVHVINGFGKAMGTTQISELAVIETPVVLTNTLSVGTAFNGVLEHALRHNPEIGTTTMGVNPIVAECNDSQLNDMRGRHVRVEDVLTAIDGASGGRVVEGHVGAGTGMVCYGWKGGIGTSSRLTSPESGSFTVGVLALANFGRSQDLTIDACRVGRVLRAPEEPNRASPPGAGSCVVVVATDAPASGRQLGRLSRRVQAGLVRTGSFGEHLSGDYAIAFSTHRRVPHWPSENQLQSSELAEDGPVIDALFQAVAEATEEAVINALFTANTIVGINGRVRHGLPVDQAIQIISRRRQ